MDLTKPSEIAKLLKDYGISVRKSWGQNFLTSSSALARIVDAAELKGTETILEVGPGLGVLTSLLLESARHVVAVEIDPLLCKVLQDRFTGRNFTLIQGDILEQNINALVKGPYKVVANLPYYITSPFLIKLIESDSPPDYAIVLVQLEVARRLTAAPGTPEYGSLSVFVQYHCQAEVGFKVGPGNFFPPPKVDSAVVILRWLPPIRRPLSEKKMFRIIRTAFSQRRKMLKGLLAREFGLETSAVERALMEIGLNPDIRGERLSVQDFINLADIMG